jgi:integrase
MAHIRRRTLKDGKTPAYLAVWKEHPAAPEQSRSFARKADAERYLVDVQHRLLTGTYAPPQLGRTPFHDVAERYLARSTWRPRTRQSAEERLRYAIAHFADRPIASIRKGDIQSFVSELQLAPSTIRVVMQHVSGVFATALDDGLLGGRNPCTGVRLPRVDNPAVLPLTVEQVTAMLEHADEWFAVAIAIGAGLGLRQSEATGLTADRVDFLRRTVTVDRQWQQASGSRLGVFSPPKTQASTRVIPADSWVLGRLAAHLKRFRTGADGVVIHYQGLPMDAAKFGHYVRIARKRADLPPTVSFHDLRHFFASALINAGCSVKQVQLAVGHKSARVTLDVYGHLWPGEEERVRDAIGRVFRQTADFSRTSPVVR